MRKAGIVLVAVAVAFLVATSSASARTRPRTVKGVYDTPAIGVAGSGFANCNLRYGCVEFRTRRTDRYVTVRIVDQSGQPVYASVTQPQSTTAGRFTQVKDVGDFCGKTKRRLKITGGRPIDVFIWGATGLDPGCEGIATQGTVTAKIYSR